MSKKALLLGHFLLLAPSTYALETDNYITWEMELKDSREAINGFIKQQIEESLETVNNWEADVTCEDVTLEIARRFKTKFPKHPLEDWIKANLSEEEVYPKQGNYRHKSIYQDPFRFYLKYQPLSPNVNIAGVYLGTDKLSHFASTGRRYLQHYLKMKRNYGMDDLEATKSAIRFGLDNEATILGWWSSGVFSYADVEANYQGLLFYKTICMNEEGNYLQKDDQGLWTLVNTPDLKEYVNPYWDESFNPSYRLAQNWELTSRVIQEKYCELSQQDRVRGRLEFYQNWNHRSFSLKYVKELQAEGYYRAPIPQEEQSFTQLCATPLN